MSKATYSGWSCPSGPAEFVDWLVDLGDEIDYDEFVESVDISTAPLDGWQIDILPTDWSVTFLKTQMPTGELAWVLQHSGIEHLFIGADTDMRDQGELASAMADYAADQDLSFWEIEDVKAFRDEFRRSL